MKKFFDEFKAFISRGNVIDLAVGVIIGGAFTAIVTSLTTDIISPLLAMATGGVNLSALSVKVGSADLMYGNFIQAIINFLIIALVVFLIVKAINKIESMAKKKEEEKAEEPKPDEQIVLLEQIRDLLKEQKK